MLSISRESWCRDFFACWFHAAGHDHLSELVMVTVIDDRFARQAASM
jgi:hypothetical protein